MGWKFTSFFFLMYFQLLLFTILHDGGAHLDTFSPVAAVAVDGDGPAIVNGKHYNLQQRKTIFFFQFAIFLRSTNFPFMQNYQQQLTEHYAPTVSKPNHTVEYINTKIRKGILFYFNLSIIFDGIASFLFLCTMFVQLLLSILLMAQLLLLNEDYGCRE